MDDLLFPGEAQFTCMLDMMQARYPHADRARLMGGFATVGLVSTLVRGVDELFKRYQLTQPRFVVVILLYFQSRLDAGEIDNPDAASRWREIRTPAVLAEVLGVTRATVTGLLDRLESSGWIKRQVNPADRRQFHISLSRTGIRRVEALLPLHVARISSVFGALSPEEYRQLHTLLGRLLTGLEQVQQEEV